MPYADLNNEDKARIEQHFNATLPALKDDEISVCLHCMQGVKEFVQVGRCVYARPCGHRQYQGKLPKPKTTKKAKQYQAGLPSLKK